MSAPAAIESLDVVLFSAGGCRVGFEARHVRACRPAAPLRGDGEIERLLGLPTAASAPTAHQWLALKRPGAAADLELMVGAPVELVALPAAAIHPLPPLLAARTALRGLRALFQSDESDSPDRLLLLFDVNALLEPRFD